MSTWPCVVLESPFGHEAESELWQSGAGRMGGPKTSMDSEFEGGVAKPYGHC